MDQQTKDAIVTALGEEVRDYKVISVTRGDSFMLCGCPDRHQMRLIEGPVVDGVATTLVAGVCHKFRTVGFREGTF